jgi:LacI family transcriptional regulator
VKNRIDELKYMENNNQPEPFGIKEIAKKANVSIATVDRVIHNRTGVSEKTKNKINAIIKEVNYEPNIFARRLASRKMLQFAALIPEVSIETDFWAAPLVGIQQAENEIRQYGIKVDTYFYDQSDKSSFVKSAKDIMKIKYDGLLLAPSFMEESTNLIQKCDEMKIPYVFINSDISDLQSLGYIGPDQYQGGYLGGRLMNCLSADKGTMLIVNITKHMVNPHHLITKEEGFRAYFKDKGIEAKIIKADIQQTDYLRRDLSRALIDNQVKGIFVTNSRVFHVADYLKENNIKDIALVGFDFLDRNIAHLEDGIIDFLICQRPQEQGYRGIMTLYNSLVQLHKTDKVYNMPIDIITKENYKFYRN